MALPVHMTLTGEQMGVIEGSCEMLGREGTILIEAMDQSMAIPTDMQTGLATGKRQYQPMRITKAFDKSSPILFQVCVTGEHLKDVTLRFYRISPVGQEENYMTYTLLNAVITSFHSYMLNCYDEQVSGRPHEEEISFTYEQIIITWEPTGIMAQDSWLTPRST